MKPIIGKKVILFELQPLDISDFATLHRQDKKGYMQSLSLAKMTQTEAEQYIALLLNTLQLIAFTVMTKEGKASRRAGYICIGDLSQHGCSISGLMSKEFAKGLSRQIKRGKYTYSQDAILTLINWVFDNLKGVDRIESNVVEKNRAGLFLTERCGFKKEGVLRDYLHINDSTENVVIYSILKREWGKNVIQSEATNGNGTGISKTNATLV